MKRLLHGLGVLWGTLTVVFFLFTLVPDPARQLAGQNEQEEVVQAIRMKYGLDKPAHVRYAQFFRGFVPLEFNSGSLRWSGLNLGRSFITDRPVVDAIRGALPATMALACLAMLMAMCIGMAVGFGLSLVNGSWIDRFILGIAALGMSAPSFVMAIGVSWLFGSVWHRWTGLPMTGGLWEIHPFEGPRIAWQHLILPACTLGVRPLSVVIQLTRNSATEVLKQSYVRTARSKGLSTARLMFKHVVRNSLNPVLTAASGWFASMLAGAVFVEFVFGWQGMGLLMFRALEQSDLPIILGCVTVIASTFVVINGAVDILYGWLDPRTRVTA